MSRVPKQWDIFEKIFGDSSFWRLTQTPGKFVVDFWKLLNTGQKNVQFNEKNIEKILRFFQLCIVPHLPLTHRENRFRSAKMWRTVWNLFVQHFRNEPYRFRPKIERLKQSTFCWNGQSFLIPTKVLFDHEILCFFFLLFSIASNMAKWFGDPGGRTDGKNVNYSLDSSPDEFIFSLLHFGWVSYGRADVSLSILLAQYCQVCCDCSDWHRTSWTYSYTFDES